MSEVDEGWSVRDLAEMAGTTVRTIHYYISEGLLPPPDGTTRNATYSAAHLARLRLIAALRNEGLALANIRQRLAPLSDRQALGLVADLDAHLARGDEGSLTTLGLIEAALADRTAVDEPVEVLDRSVPPPAAVSRIADAPGSAKDYLQQLRRSKKALPEKPVPPRQPWPMKPKPGESDRPETWYHYTIEDGIELRVREDRYRESAGRLRAVVDTLRATLQRYGLKRPDWIESDP